MMEDRSLRDITLPSEGELYEGKLPGGKIHVKIWDTVIEELFISGGGTPNTLITDVLDRSIVELPWPNGSKELLSGDRYYAFFMLRAESYGAGYGFPMRCSSCGKQWREEINLTKDLDLIKLPEGAVEPFELVLPYSGSRLQFRLLRGYDEEEIESHIERINKARLKGGSLRTRGGRIIREADEGEKKKKHIDPSFRFRLARQVVAVDSKDLDFDEALEFVSNLKAPDSLALRQAIDKTAPGIDMRLLVDCEWCGFENDHILPFTSEFLNPRL
jgi:hypothetical protein